jgi:hypothetical protein
MIMTDKRRTLFGMIARPRTRFVQMVPSAVETESALAASQLARAEP